MNSHEKVITRNNALIKLKRILEKNRQLLGGLSTTTYLLFGLLTLIDPNLLPAGISAISINVLSNFLDNFSSKSEKETEIIQEVKNILDQSQILSQDNFYNYMAPIYPEILMIRNKLDSVITSDELNKIISPLTLALQDLKDQNSSLNNEIASQTYLASRSRKSTQELTNNDPQILINYLFSLYEVIENETCLASQNSIDLQIFNELNDSSTTPRTMNINNLPQNNYSKIAVINSQKRINAFSSLSEAFVYHNKKLLLLGPAGSGKTTLLLNFAKSAIISRLNDKSKPIPVVVNLSAWNLNKKLKDWIEEQTNNSIPKEMPKLYIFDGLDEINLHSKSDSLAAQNQFCKEFNESFSNNESIISCRTNNFREITTDIRINGKVSIGELNKNNIKTYLQQNHLQQVYSQIYKDNKMLYLLRTPLMLSLYANSFINQSKFINNKETTYEWDLLNNFVKSRLELERKRSQVSFSNKEIYDFLGKLAIKRKSNGVIIFSNNFTYLEMLEIAKNNAQLINFCLEVGLISDSRPLGNYKFVHKLIRDYFSIEPLIKIICSTSGFGKGYAAYAFEEIGSLAIKKLHNLLLSEDNDAKEKALWALRIIGDSSSAPFIIKMLFDDDETVRWYAIETLSSLENESVTPYLLENLEEDPPNPYIRKALIMALGKIGSDKEIPFIKQYLQDDAMIVREEAKLALETLGVELSEISYKSHEDELDDEES